MDKYFDDRPMPTPDPGWDIEPIYRRRESNRVFSPHENNYFGVSEFEEPKLLAAFTNYTLNLFDLFLDPHPIQKTEIRKKLNKNKAILLDFIKQYTLEGLCKGYPEMSRVLEGINGIQ